MAPKEGVVRRVALILPAAISILVAGCAGYGFLGDQNMADAVLPNLRPTAKPTTYTAPPTIDVSTVKATVLATMPAASRAIATREYTPKVVQNDQSKQYKANSQFGSEAQMKYTGVDAPAGLTLSKPVSIPYTADNRTGLPELGKQNVGTTGQNRGFWYNVTITNKGTTALDLTSLKTIAAVGGITCKDLLGSDSDGNNFFGAVDPEKFFTDPATATKVEPGASVTFPFAMACQADRGTPISLRVYTGADIKSARIYNFQLP